MQTLPRATLATLTALVAVGIGAESLAAQDPVQPDQVCTAQVLTSRISTPEPAARVVVTLPEAIGEEIAFEPRAGSGLTLANTEDLGRVPMANEGERPEPVEIANEGRRITLFLNTSSAQPGVHQFALKGSAGTCTGSLNVAPGS
jgi:hypothetical protein